MVSQRIGSLPNSMQRTALRAAADACRYADAIQSPLDIPKMTWER